MAYYSDYDENFIRQADGDVKKDDDIAAILNSLSNIILTRQGERRMLPTFAANIKNLLFEPIDEITARHIAENILDAIKIWDVRITVTGFDIEPLYDENAYRCRLNFVIIGGNEVESIDFILTK